MTRTATALLFLLGLAAPASAQWSAGPIYNVLDAGNLPGIAAGSVGGTTALERDFAFRPGTPATIFLARGGTSTGDSRTGGAIGLAAILRTPFSTSNYTDTGVVTSGGAPTAFTGMQSIAYEPVDDQLYVLDGFSGSQPYVWRIAGGSLGGSPSGGGVGVPAAAVSPSRLFQNTNTGMPASGTGRGLAVMKSGTTVNLALGMGTYVTVWQSVGGAPFSRVWSSAALAASGSAVRDVAFDPSGNVWATLSGEVSRGVRYFPAASSGAGVAGTGVTLANGAADNTSAGAAVNGLAFYREGGETFLIAGLRSGATGNPVFYARYRVVGTTLTALDGFGNAILASANTGNTVADATLAAARPLATGGVTIPSLTSVASQYIALPYKSDGSFELSERSVFVHAAALQGAQVTPTSGIITALLPPSLTFSRTFDASEGGPIAPGTMQAPVLGFRVDVDRASKRLTSLTVTRTGTATDAETGNVKVWLDADGSKTVTGGDTELGTGTFSGETGTLALALSADAVATAPGTDFLVTVDVAPEPPQARRPDAPGAQRVQAGTFGLSVPQAGVAVEGAGAVLGSNFPIATAGSASLPVELSAFTGTANGRVAHLAWTTASETNNAGFAVEQQRGTGSAATWAEHGFVAGHGTTTEQRSYAFDVPGLTAGRHTFRLRQTDTDGKVTYSPSVTVEIALEGRFTLSEAMPNPTAVSAQWALQLADGQRVRAEAFDLLGRRVATLFDGEAAAGTTMFALDASGLASGLYVVQVVGETFRTTRRVQVAR